MTTTKLAAKRRPLWYFPEQLTSSEPHVVVPAIARHGPGLGEEVTPAAIDLLLSATAYERLAARVAQ